MEHQQYHNMWLSSSAKPREEPEFAPLRYIGTVLEELWACDLNLRDHSSERTLERVIGLVSAHTYPTREDTPPKVQKARYDGLKYACENRKLFHVVDVLAQHETRIFNYHKEELQK